LVLAVWVIVSLRTELFSPEIREAGGPKVMSGDPAMPDKPMEEAVNGAQRRMVAKYRGSHRFRWLGRCADWLAFLLTATITVIVGATGQLVKAGEDPAARGLEAAESGALGAKQKWVRWIGVMAALAAVMIAVSSRFGAVSQEEMDRGEKLRELITTSRVTYAGAATPAEGQKVVDSLVAGTEQIS
jgi:hypothetical protein